jgi:hypothetical protein
VWQKKLTLKGRVVPAASAVSSRSIASGDSMAQGREPSAPALLTATASAAPCTPAIGAWIKGCSVPSRVVSAFMRAFSPGHPTG